jgi:rod shape-determining protein MreC
VKPLFIHGPAAGLRLLVFILLSVVMMTLDHRGSRLEGVRNVLSSALYPVQYAVDLPIQAGRWMHQNWASRDAVLAENARLRRRTLVLESRMTRLNELEAENRRLRSLLNSSNKVSERVLIGEVLAVDMDPFSQQITLNKGKQEGVFEGQSVVDANGIMGQIIHVGPFSSNALLITDPSHALPVQVARTGLRAIAIGMGSVNLLELSHVPNSADLRQGDVLVTSGLGGRFPAGYPVGNIIDVERDSGQPFARVRIRPMARLERNREVLLVWPTQSTAVSGVPASPEEMDDMAPLTGQEQP